MPDFEFKEDFSNGDYNKDLKALSTADQDIQTDTFKKIKELGVIKVEKVIQIENKNIRTGIISVFNFFNKK